MRVSAFYRQEPPQARDEEVLKHKDAARKGPTLSSYAVVCSNSRDGRCSACGRLPGKRLASGMLPRTRLPRKMQPFSMTQ